MKTLIQKFVHALSKHTPRRKLSLANALAGIIPVILCLLLATLSAGAATTNFLNVASVVNGGSYGLDDPYWNTTSETATPLVDFAASDYVTIGANPSDFNGEAFSIPFNYSASTHFTGSGSVVAIYATNVVVTFNGADNDYFDGATTLYVAQGSTLIEDVDWDGLGLNFDKQTITLLGGGMITFQTPIGVNESSGGGVITENMTGGTVNLTVGTGATDPFTTGFTLTAGTLLFTTAASANAFNGFTTAAFTINGGTIDNTSGSPLTMGMTTGTNVLGGNFTFTGSSSLNFGPEPWTNNANHTITVGANQLTFGGGIRGAGTGLTLVGTSAGSTVTLAGANTYTGNTAVQGGTLALTNLGALASPLVLVSNATFDISGLNVSYAGTGAIVLTNSTFNVSNTLVSAVSAFGVTNSILNISEFSSSSTNVATTVLNVGGTTNIINITTLPLVTGYPQIYRLIQATTVNGALNFGLGTIPSASTPYTAYLTNVTASGSVNLVLTGGPVPVRNLIWNGRAGATPDNTWDVGDASNTNWLDAGVATFFNNLDFVTFDDTATGLTTVNLSGGLTPGSLVVSNNALTYTFTGGSLSDGSGPLTLNKKNTGTLVLQESGDYFSGGINVSAGTVVVDNNSGGISGGMLIAPGAAVQLGNNDTGATLPAGAATVNGTLVLNAADIPTTVSTEILGSGEVEQINTNTVILADNGASSGAWSVLVTNGTLQAEDNTALGSLPGGLVTITNGGTFDVGGNPTANNANFGTKQFNIAGAGGGGNGAIVNSSLNTQEDAFQNIALTANATIGGAGRWDMRNGTPLLALNGFTLIKTNDNHVAVVSGHVTSGNIIIQQGMLSFEVTPNFDVSTGTIQVTAGAYVALYEDTLGSFTRGIVLNGGGIENISAAGTAAFLDAPVLLTANSTLATSAGIEFLNGVIADGGNGFGLTQTGTGNVGVGTNFLSATNTYSGATCVGQGSLGLTNHGSIYESELISVTNDAIFDISGLAVPFSGTNSLVLGDDAQGQGILNLGATLIANFNYLSISNANINMAVATAGVAPITVTNLNLGDGGASSGINIIALPVILPAQFPLIKYVNLSGPYNNLYLAGTPAGYSGNLVNNTANHSIDLVITGQPAGIWNGGGSPDNDWSDSANWTGENLAGTDPLIFTGTTGLNNTNDTSNETATLIDFYAGAGAFTLNGNGVTLNSGVTNNSSNPQTINLGLSFGSNGTNYALQGGSSAATALTIGGGLTNTADLVPGYTTLTLGGYGVLNNTLNSVNSPGGTNIVLLTTGTANWTLLDNSSATAMTVPWDFQINAGTFNFGSGSSAPVLASTSTQGVPQDNQLGDVSGTTGTLNMNAGTWTLTARLNTALATSCTGIVSQVGGIINIGSQFQGANGSNTNEYSIVNLTGGTMNIGSAATPTGPFYVASRGAGSLTLTNSAALNCGNLDIARNANGNTFGSVGVVNLNGGKLTAGLVGTATANSQTGPPTISGANPSATFNFNGGTLQASTNAANFFQGSLVAPIIPITAVVKTGGAIISDGGFAITVATPLIHDSTLGATTDGGLIKLGAGTLTLTAANTYTGGTTVSNGVLAVDGSLAAASAVNVTAAGTLSGNGTIAGNVTVNGTIEPGVTNDAATLTVQGNVTIAGTNTSKLDLINSANDELVVGGALTYGGTLNVILLSGTPALNQTFKLFNATSESGSFAATNLPALTAGLAWNFNPASGTLSVIQSQTINTTPAPIVATVSGNTLNLMWPANQTGWTLQVQTNSTATGLSNNWVSLPGSTSGNTYSITIDPTQGSVFYRLYYLP